MNLIGKKFHKLTVISERRAGKRTYCLCKCECGNIKEIRKDEVGKTFSCGCTIKTFGENYNKRLRKIWESMHSRCECKTHKGFPIYKDKPICDDWHRKPRKCMQTGFFNFQKWAIENGYEDNLSLDRIDNAKGYSPENCRWVTIKQQARNTTKNIVIEMYGEKHILIEWCEIFGISQVKIQHTVKRHGLTYQQAFDRHLNYVYNPSKWCWEKKSA